MNEQLKISGCGYFLNLCLFVFIIKAFDVNAFSHWQFWWNKETKVVYHDDAASGCVPALVHAGRRQKVSTRIGSFFDSSQENENNGEKADLEPDSFASLRNSASVLFSPPTLDDDQEASTATKGIIHEEMEATQGWDVYVCQSKPCKERGSGATLDAFVGLAPINSIAVHPAILMKTKGIKGPNVRCVKRGPNGKAFDIKNVDSVDKVYMILTKYMGITGVDTAARECLKWNYRGNALLEKGEISGAIDAYNKAIATGYTEQEGLILLMRATAYLKRASDHQKELRLVVSDLAQSVPDPAGLGRMYSTAMEHPALANSIFQRVMSDCKAQDKKFRKTKYRHGLYEYALLHATQDALRATQLLPQYAKAWLRAGDSLAELRKFKESAQYYQKALELDTSLSGVLTPLIQRLEKSQQFLDEARSNGWSEDTLRLALDVTG